MAIQKQEKLAVLSRIDLLTEQILRNKFRIYDVCDRIAGCNARLPIFLSSEIYRHMCWLHGLLQKHALIGFRPLDEIGAELMPEYKDSSLDEVMSLVNEESATV